MLTFSIVGMEDNQTTYLIMGIKSQMKVHYAMPVRNMLYDAMQYVGQVGKAHASYRKKSRGGEEKVKLTAEESLSGFRKDGKLVPVITLVVYFGPDEWDAPVSLDEMFSIENSRMNNVAYHLQQAVEKTLKAFLECAGVTVPNTHDIDKLVRMSRNNGSRVVITEWVEDKADMLTRWETDTRYDMDYCVESGKVRIGLEEVQYFLTVNGLSYELRDELKNDTVKRKLTALFPKDYVPSDIFEWNCLYQVFSKKLK